LDKGIEKTIISDGELKAHSAIVEFAGKVVLAHSKAQPKSGGILRRRSRTYRTLMFSITGTRGLQSHSECEIGMVLNSANGLMSLGA
jgi:hypothetical protein